MSTKSRERKFDRRLSTATTKTASTQRGLLESLARHEIELVSKIQTAESTAQRMIEEARAEAANYVNDETRRLEAEVFQLRSNAHEQREAERLAFRSKTLAYLEQLRREAAGKTSAVIDEVVSMVLPHNRGKEGAH